VPVVYAGIHERLLRRRASKATPFGSAAAPHLQES
jgi:hypothetical protein